MNAMDLERAKVKGEIFVCFLHCELILPHSFVMEGVINITSVYQFGALRAPDADPPPFSADPI